MGKVFRGMLRFHMLDTSVWARAARFEWEEAEEDKDRRWENARKLLLEGLRFNAGSTELLREYFWFELSHWKHLLKAGQQESAERQEEEDEEEGEDPVLRGEIARMVFEEAARSAEERSESEEDAAAFLCSLLKVASGFEACRAGEESWFGVGDIKRHLLDKYPGHPVVWDSLSNLELSPGAGGIVDAKTLESSLETYREGLEKVGEEKGQLLRKLRASSLLSLASAAEAKVTLKERRLLLEALQGACAEDMEEGAGEGISLTEEELKTWVRSRIDYFFLGYFLHYHSFSTFLPAHPDSAARETKAEGSHEDTRSHTSPRVKKALSFPPFFSF